MEDTITNDQEAQREARDQRIRQNVYAYKRLFATEDGQAVLEDIRKSFGVDMPAYLPTNTRIGGNIQYDDIYGKIRDGQRSVWIHIQNNINSPLEPDGNRTEPLRVIR